MWDWAQSQLFKFICEEHFRDLLRRNVIKLNEGEKRPPTPEYLKKVKPEHRARINLNPANEPILTLVECQYLQELFTSTQMKPDELKQSQARKTI